MGALEGLYYRVVRVGVVWVFEVAEGLWFLFVGCGGLWAQGGMPLFLGL